MPTEGIAAVAERIRERANQLNSELAVLELVKTEQDQQQAILDDEVDKCESVRRKYLSSTRSRHGIELELWRIEGQRKDCRESIEEQRQQTKDILEYKQELQENWESLVRDVLSVHSLHREIYRHSIHNSIEEREKLTVKRDRQLSALAQHVDSFNNSKEKIKEEQKVVGEEIENLKRSEQQGDAKVSSLAAQIREMLAKVKLSIALYSYRRLVC